VISKPRHPENSRLEAGATAYSFVATRGGGTIIRFIKLSAAENTAQPPSA